MKKVVSYILIVTLFFSISMSCYSVDGLGTKKLTEAKGFLEYLISDQYTDYWSSGYQVISLPVDGLNDNCKEFFKLFNDVMLGKNTRYQPLITFGYDGDDLFYERYGHQFIYFTLFDTTQQIDFLTSGGSVFAYGSFSQVSFSLNRLSTSASLKPFGKGKEYFQLQGMNYRRFILLGNYFINFLQNENYLNLIKTKDFLSYSIPDYSRFLIADDAGIFTLPSLIEPEPEPSYELPYDASIFDSFISTFRDILLAPLPVGIFLFSSMLFIAFFVRFFKKMSRC